MTETIHDMLLDRMPEVARGAGTWSPAEAAHLAGCAECRTAWEVVRDGAALGAGIERTFDGAASGRRVVERLRTSGASHSTGRPWVLALVAAAAAVLFVVLRAPHAAPPAPVPVAEARFLPELDSLTTDELATVAEGIDPPAGALELQDGQPLFDLDSTQLERVLRSLEG